jgi:hypothetical protein
VRKSLQIIQVQQLHKDKDIILKIYSSEETLFYFQDISIIYYAQLSPQFTSLISSLKIACKAKMCTTKYAANDDS